MKRVFSAILVFVLLLVTSVIGSSVSAAANSAFDKETFRVKEGNLNILWDNTDNSGGSSNNPLQWAANYGTGRNDQGDIVAYNDVDFGSKGASKVTVNFGFHNPEKYDETSFAIYIDNPYGDPIATFTVKKGETAGSEIVNHKEFTANCEVTPGKHDVYFMATNPASGSFDYIYFTESSSVIKATKTVKNPLTYPSQNPFQNLVISPETWKKTAILLDKWTGTPQTNQIQAMADYGCGYSSTDDMVVFPNCNFGTKGAKAVTINFSYANNDYTTIGIFIDNPLGEPSATFKITNTGGWTKDKAKEFTTDINVPAGNHTVFVRFMDNTGSFTHVRFTEGDKVQTPVGASASTPDLIALPITAAAISFIGLAVTKRRNKK
jgi:hypothetical protein